MTQGRKRSGPRAVSQCLYFPDDELVFRVREMLAKYPRATMSAVFAQFMGPLEEALTAIKDDPNKRVIEVNARVYL